MGFIIKTGESGKRTAVEGHRASGNAAHSPDLFKLDQHLPNFFTFPKVSGMESV
jgi:hypothetical protein